MKRLTKIQKDSVAIDYLTGNFNCVSLGKLHGVGRKQVRNLLRKRNIYIEQDKSKLFRIYKVNHDYFSKIDTEEKAYWLGFLYADGYNDEKHGIVQLGLQECDRIVVEKFRDAIASNNPIEIRYDGIKKPNSQNICRIRICSKKMSQDLSKLGCFQKKSLTLKFPTEKQVPSDLLQHFIRGMWDGDGCLWIKMVKNNGIFVAILTSTLDVCTTVYNILLKELNILARITTPFPERNNSTRNLTLSGRINFCNFCNWLYENSSLYLERKYEKYLIAQTYGDLCQ